MSEPRGARGIPSIERFLDELTAWGRRVNLVGSTSPDALQVHVSDALGVVDALPAGARVVDLGSGAGFPGIPLALVRPDLRLTLVEIRERRVAFLRHVKRVLGAGFEVRRTRIEHGPEPSGPYEFALMRAVAPLRRALPLARPWVHDDGEIWVWTREAVPESVDPATGLAGRIELGARGQVLRVRAAAVPRGTL
ncbi:MAG: 16S rRNA (guanine(527)-N(7))-methyltransferase RsmG [Myxococcales bacterium]|nr:16S rRNA (guanine(527)-N(7))-methyltransferase RsmG [Myxococcales bacterium]